MIAVTINGVTKEFEKGAFLDKIIASLNLSDQGIAVAINDLVIPHSQWQKTELNSDDQVLIVSAAQGG